MASNLANEPISFGELKGLRLRSDTLMDRETGLNILDDHHLRNSLIDILTTRLGSRIMLREYGCRLYDMLDRPMNRDLILEIYSSLHQAIQDWEPRILITKLKMDASRWQYGHLSIAMEGHYLLENGPMRIDDLSLNFLAVNKYNVVDPTRSAREFSIESFGEFVSAQKDSYVLTAAGDVGFPNAKQTEMAARMKSFNPEVFLLAGDLNYHDGEGRTIMANTAVFNDEILEGRVYPAIGNHEENFRKANGDLTPHLQRYFYLPGNKRYYRVNLFGGMLTVFVINTGYSTSRVPRLEPDGNTAGSLQHQWILSELQKCDSPYVMVMGHHPFASRVTSGTDDTYPDLAWIKELPKVQLYYHGHTHTAQHNVYAPSGVLKMHVLDTSAGVQSSRNMSSAGTMYGASLGMQGVWAYAANGTTGPSCVTKFTVTRQNLLVEVIASTTGEVRHSFTIKPWT